MPSLSSGQQLSARYTLRERLSGGALGETWRAHDAARDRDVVVKLLPRAAASEEVMHSLRVELEAARSLDPRMIAAAEALERDAGQSYLLREYVPGRDLSTLRGESWRRIVPAAAQVAEALAALHERGIVHRDVKSSNVVLRPDGTATLIDLGSAAFAGAAADHGALSPYSASPQQLAGEPPTPADDAYAFGVLLYELLSGYPPFYPNFSRERVLREPVAALRPTRAAPGQLTELVMQLLAKAPAERPARMAEIAHRLRELERAAADADAATPSATPGAAPIPTIVRPALRVPAHAAGEHGRARADARRRALIGAAFVVLVLLAAAVFVLLPELARRAAPRGADVEPAATRAQDAGPDTPPAEPEVDLRVLAEQMQEAERMREAYDALYPSLEKRAAAQWAAQPFAAAREHADEARRQFEARRFLDARAAFAAGLGELQKVSERARPALAEQLDKGKAALAAGQSSAAEAAFALALRIDPGNQTATKGLKRAQSLDRVLALVAAGSNDERAGQMQSAAQRYQQALDLDPDAQAARDGLARVRARIASEEFALAMSRGLKQLEAGNLSDARSSFERAARLRPGAREVSDALARVAEASEQRAIAAHRARATQLERAERWAEALTEYEAALKLDPALEFALAGRERVTPRTELARQMDTLIASPGRLLAEAVREQARALLAEAEKIPAPGPVLRRQLQQLGASLTRYETPVRVALLSDSQTEVVVYRVGSMGAFERREIELPPGTYTVKGSRVGFRDVRRELTVLPGEAPPPLVIRCEDPI